ncbi:MAG: TerD family protein [Candidatus Microthrix sp.]|nr:TerD family protein [Candidatus Microthrix sp.]MBK7018069.1 TerD family protein [Candidatus Microthrix sp.]
MAAPLVRGANVALTREIPSLTGVVLGIRWGPGSDPALHDNLVAAAMLCGSDGNVRSDQDLVFFNQVVSQDASVARLTELLGDDDEQIEVDLASVPADIDRIVAVLYINEGSASKRALGQLQSCVIRVLNLADNVELVRSEDLAQALNAETSVILGQLYRHQGGWKFKVVGQGSSAGLRGIAQAHGLKL